MKKPYVLVILSLVWCLIHPMRWVDAQPEPKPVYVVTSSAAVDTVSVWNPSDLTSMPLLAVPRRARGSLMQVLPAAERELVNQYLREYNATARYPIHDLSKVAVEARVDSIAVSPDNQHVVVEVIYRICFGPPQLRTCFGATRLALLDRISGEQRLLLDFGFHDASLYLSSYPSPVPYYAEMGIARIHWTPDQQAVLVGITDGALRSPPRYTIVALPINGGKPVRLAEGITWVIAPDSRHLTVLDTWQIEGGTLPNTLKIITFDLSVGLVSETRHELGTWYISNEARLAYLGERLLFKVAYDGAMIEGGGGLAIFDPQTRKASLVSPNIFIRLENTPDGKRILIETGDHTLVEAVTDGDAITLQPLLSTPVTDWKLGSDGDLLVQFNGEAAYQILDRQGRRLATLNLVEQVRLQAAPGSQQVTLLAVDW